VVTHKGRSADGGHYVGWVHKSGDDWVQYDDDIVTSVKIDDILALRGGGDWHTAYLCIYRKLEVVKKWCLASLWLFHSTLFIVQLYLIRKKNQGLQSSFNTFS